MELRQYTAALLKWWWLIVASVAIATVSSFLGTRATPPTYISRTTIMVGQALQNPDPSQSDLYTGQALAQTYADLAKREPVLRGTLAAFGLTWNWTDLQKMVSSQVVPGTQLLQITVLDNDPERARLLADEIAQQLILQSPSSTDPQKEAERQFVLTQIADLKTNITNAQAEMRDLDNVIATANSARQIQDARSRQQALQLQISTWQATYAQLLTNLQQGTPNFLSVVEPASNGAQVGPNTVYNLLLAAAIGLVLSGGAAVLLEYLDDTVKTPDDIQHVRQLPTLAGIARMNGEEPDRKLITLHHPRSPVAEAYRVLRTSIQFSDIDRPKRSLLITSASAGEGKTTTAANLAVVIAQAGHRVLLIDADLRRPMLHKYFDVANFLGLTDLLLQVDLSEEVERIRAVFDPAIRTTPVEGLFLLSSGPLPPNPSELLGSAKMKAALAALETQYDYVVFDSPPVLAVTDAVVLATQVDSVLFVVDAGHTRQGALQQAADRLAKANIHIAGVVLNRLSRRSDGYYYYYHHDYRYYGSDGSGDGPSDGHANGNGNGNGASAGTARSNGRRGSKGRREQPETTPAAKS